MPGLRIVMDADGQYPDAKQLGLVTSIGRLKRGMVSGESSVVVEITMEDGTKHYGQTSFLLLESCTRGFRSCENQENGI